MASYPTTTMSEDQLISYRLQKLEEAVAKIDANVDSLSDEVIGWRGKASAWGVIAGGVMAFLVSIAAQTFGAKNH